MQAASDRLEFAPPATPGLLRALLLALLAHGLLVAALTWGVQWKRDAQQLSVDAELWAAVPQEAAPPEPPLPPPAPEPVQRPPAPQPVVEPPKVDIALAREKQRLQKQNQLELEKQQEKLRQEKLRQDQLKADKLKQAQADKAKLAQEKKKAEQEAKRLEAQRQQNLQRMAGMAGASGSASGMALKSAGPSASYAGRIRARVKPNIVFTEDIAGNPTAEVEVRTAPNGTIVGRKITQSSGVKEWDDAVLKAIDKTQVLPRDIDGSMPSALLLIFRPKD